MCVSQGCSFWQDNPIPVEFAYFLKGFRVVEEMKDRLLMLYTHCGHSDEEYVVESPVGEDEEPYWEEEEEDEEPYWGEEGEEPDELMGRKPRHTDQRLGGCGGDGVLIHEGERPMVTPVWYTEFRKTVEELVGKVRERRCKDGDGV